MDIKITSFDRKIFGFSISADDYYYPLNNPFTPLYYYNPIKTTRLNVERKFLGSSMPDASLNNRGFNIFVRAYENDGTLKVTQITNISLNLKNIKYDYDNPQTSPNRLYIIDYSDTFENLIGQDFSQYR